MKYIKKFNRLFDKLCYKATEDLFTLVAQDDFNPDTVLEFGADSYSRGLAHMVIVQIIGAVIGVVSSFIKERKAK